MNEELGRILQCIYCFSLLVVWIWVQRTDALVCLSCRGVPLPVHCGYVQTCGIHEKCLLELEIPPGGALTYNLGCVERRKCVGAGKRSNSAERRQSILVKSECCRSHDLCNVQTDTVQGYSADRGPICYSCHQQLHPDSCSAIAVCGRDEHCFIQKTTILGKPVYTSGCINRLNCNRHARSLTQPSYTAGGNGTAFLAESDDTALSETTCCSTDLCNNKIPVDGSWNAWLPWSSCTQSCGGGGTRVRTRTCTPPINGGIPCTGNDRQTDDTCANRRCHVGLQCLKCEASVLPQTCNTLETCGAHEACVLEQYVMNRGVFYHSGCKDLKQCAIGKRYLLTDTAVPCSECCHDGDLCNSNGCGQSGFPQNRGPVCYACDQQTEGSGCFQIDLCRVGEVCGITRSVIAGVTVYRTACIEELQCGTTDVHNNVYPKCCHADLCDFARPHNVTGVSQGTTSAVTSGPTQAPCNPPVITDIVPSGDFVVNSPFFTLTCVTKGDPTPSVQWHHHDTLLASQVGNMLLFKSITADDIENGKYECRVANKCGHDEMRFP